MHVCVRACVSVCVFAACQLKAIPNPQSVRRAVFVGNFKAVTRKTTSTLSVDQATKPRLEIGQLHQVAQRRLAAEIYGIVIERRTNLQIYVYMLPIRPSQD